MFFCFSPWGRSSELLRQEGWISLVKVDLHRPMGQQALTTIPCPNFDILGLRTQLVLQACYEIFFITPYESCNNFKTDSSFAIVEKLFSPTKIYILNIKTLGQGVRSQGTLPCLTGKIKVSRQKFDYQGFFAKPIIKEQRCDAVGNLLFAKICAISALILPETNVIG